MSNITKIIVLLTLSGFLAGCNAQRSHDVAVGALGGLILHDILTDN